MPRKRVFTGAVRLTSIAAIVAIAGCAHQTTTTTPPSDRGPIGYVTDPSGNVVHSGSGQCVRTGFWQPQNAIKECDPEIFAANNPPPPAPKPPEVAAAPATPAPEPQPAAAPEPVRVYVGTDAYFAFNQAQLGQKDEQTLDKVAERLQSDDQLSVRVVGFADQIGSEDYNLSLSQRRADAVKSYLIDHGVPEAVVSVEARGEADPIVSCEGQQGRTLIDCLQPNRRVEIEFSGLEPPEQR